MSRRIKKADITFPVSKQDHRCYTAVLEHAFTAHTDAVRGLAAVDAAGGQAAALATGADDGTVSLWEVPSVRADGAAAPASKARLVRCGFTSLTPTDAAMMDRVLALAADAFRTTRAALMARIDAGELALQCANLKVASASCAADTADAAQSLHRLLSAAAGRNGTPASAAAAQDFLRGVGDTGLNLSRHGHRCPVECVASCTPRQRPGGVVVSGGWDGSLRVWDVATARCVGTFGGGHGAYHRPPPGLSPAAPDVDDSLGGGCARGFEAFEAALRPGGGGGGGVAVQEKILETARVSSQITALSVMHSRYLLVGTRDGDVFVWDMHDVFEKAAAADTTAFTTAVTGEAGDGPGGASGAAKKNRTCDTDAASGVGLFDVEDEADAPEEGGGDDGGEFDFGHAFLVAAIQGAHRFPVLGVHPAAPWSADGRLRGAFVSVSLPQVAHVWHLPGFAPDTDSDGSDSGDEGAEDGMRRALSGSTADGSDDDSAATESDDEPTLSRAERHQRRELVRRGFVAGRDKERREERRRRRERAARTEARAFLKAEALRTDPVVPTFRSRFGELYRGTLPVHAMMSARKLAHWSAEDAANSGSTGFFYFEDGQLVRGDGSADHKKGEAGHGHAAAPGGADPSGLTGAAWAEHLLNDSPGVVADDRDGRPTDLYRSVSSPDGSVLALLFASGDVHLWSVATMTHRTALRRKNFFCIPHVALTVGDAAAVGGRGSAVAAQLSVSRLPRPQHSNSYVQRLPRVTDATFSAEHFWLVLLAADTRCLYIFDVVTEEFVLWTELPPVPSLAAASSPSASGDYSSAPSSPGAAASPSSAKGQYIRVSADTMTRDRFFVSTDTGHVVAVQVKEFDDWMGRFVHPDPPSL